MWSLALAAVLMVPSDTVTVRPGDVLVIDRLSGELVLEGTDDEVLSIIHADSPAFEFERRGSQIRLMPTRGRRIEGEIELQVPRGMRVEIVGGELAVEVEGMEGGIRVDISEGDVYLSQMVGQVEVSTLDGDVSLRDGSGAALLATLDGEIDVVNQRGDVTASSIDGDVTLRGVEANSVEATTLDGDVVFDGQVGPRGSLSLVTHSGDVSLWLPADFGGQFEISTVDGNFESEFPVRVGSVGAGKALRFQLRDGQARILIQNFDGDIRLLSR